MTSITIQGDGGRYRLIAVGHATGSREVCAAVSGLVYALGGYLKNLEAAGEAHITAFTLESGEAELEAEGDVRGAFELAAIGLLQIARSCPEQVLVDTKNFFKIPGGNFALP